MVHVVQRWISGKQTLCLQHSHLTPATRFLKPCAQEILVEAHIRLLDMLAIAILMAVTLIRIEWVIRHSTERA